MSISPCPPPSTPPTGVVVFVPSVFTALYPEFSTVSTAALQFNFNRATLQLNNCCSSRVQNAQTREVLLGLLTAHITALSQGVNGQPPAGVVGRASQAAEGSVSVTAEMSSQVGQSQAYYLQTKYGAEFWQASAIFRTARYLPPRSGASYGDYGINYFGPTPWSGW